MEFLVTRPEHTTGEHNVHFEPVMRSRRMTLKSETAKWTKVVQAAKIPQQ